MRLLKKIIRKLYHLIWFLSLFIIFFSPVKAEVISNMTYSTFRTYAASYPILSNQYIFTTRDLVPINMNAVAGGSPFEWITSYNMSCSGTTIITGKMRFDGNSNLTYDWLTENIKDIYYNPNYSGAVSSYCSFSINPTNLQLSYSCTTSEPHNNYIIGGHFTQRNGNFSTQFLIWREVNITCDKSATAIIDNNNVNTDRIINDNRQQQEETREKIEENTDAINGVDDTLKDETAPTIDLSDLEVSSDTPISDLITMPLTILNTLIQTLDGSCTNYTIPFFYNSTVTFPCFTISDYLGSNLTNYIDLFICFYMCYNIAMLVISVFEDITSLQDIYNSLYVPKHARGDYQPRHARGGGD